MRFELKGLKNWTGMEGIGYQASLYGDGARIAQFTDDGDGGMIRWAIFSQPGMDAFRALARTRFAGLSSEADAVDMLAATLADAEAVLKKYKRMTAKETVFYRPSTPLGEYMTVKRPLDDAVRAFILRKYPDATIINGNLDAEIARVMAAPLPEETGTDGH